MSRSEETGLQSQVADTEARRVLIVDDETAVLSVCARAAAELGFECTTVTDGDEAAGLLAATEFDVLLTDVRMPGRNGFQLLAGVEERSLDTLVIMMTAYGTIDEAVDVMKRGVFDYVAKPFDLGRLRSVLEGAANWLDQKALRAAKRAAAAKEGVFHGIAGRSPAMQEVFERIARAAGVESTVLIQGESGTGKELVARAVHACSRRSDGPFLPLDCGAVNENLIESELFGHIRGAFTGAHKDNPGILRSATGGTVFLDEIGELPAAVQAKLLRTLQEKEVRPVGGIEPEAFDARIIAATNRNLEEDALRGDFRRDLFYRLHVIPIHVPPLRERREDIPLLVETFLLRHSDPAEEPVELAPEAMNAILNYDWPGNVRELENCIEQACVFRKGSVIAPKDLFAALGPSRRDTGAPLPADGKIRPLTVHEEEIVRDALIKTGNNKTRAARALGISLPTLYAKIRKYDIQADARSG